MAKSIIYIDIEDDISTIISNVETSKDKVVALVLPKPASVFLSTINMRLLKKAADSLKKSLVLITSDSSIVPLAAAVGLHTAKSLNAKPVLAKVAKVLTEPAESNAVSDDLEDVAEVPLQAPKRLDDDTLEIDNTQKMTKTVLLGKKNRKLKIPNFTSFRLRVFLGLFVSVVLIAAWFIGFVIMPSAQITLKTEVSSVNSDIVITANSAIKDFDAKSLVLPATLATVKKSDSEKVPATGKKDIGTKATGNVKMINCNKDDKLSDTMRTVPAGTQISDSNGNILVTQQDVTIEPSSYTGNTCNENKPSVSVGVAAQNAGGQYNLSPRSYTVGGFATITAEDKNGLGGGTSNVIAVVSAQDIESGKQKLSGKSKSAAVGELTTQIESGNQLALDETLTEESPTYTTSAAVDAEVAEVTVSSVTTYSMLGISQDNLKTLIETDIASKITDSKQKILDNGLGNKKLLLSDKKSPTEQKLSVSVVGTVGPDIDTSGIAAEAVGKTRGQIQRVLSERAGVKEVSVRYEPFWITSTPKKASKIKVIVEQVNAK